MINESMVSFGPNSFGPNILCIPFIKKGNSLFEKSVNFI